MRVEDRVDGERVGDVMDLSRCLLLQCQRPSEPPVSKGRASASDWWRSVERGLALGMFALLDVQTFSRDQEGRRVLNGAMAVPELQSQSFISVSARTSKPSQRLIFTFFPL